MLSSKLLAAATAMIIGSSAIAAAENTEITYPRTARMSNPLFVDFTSEMYHRNDTLGTLYTADASGHVWADGRLYVYASHDLEPARGCDRMDKYHVFSTDDLVNWTDHGQILSSYDVMDQEGWGIEGWMWAPDCAYNPADSTYYFYFPHVNKPLPQGGHDWRIGVAKSKNPATGFKLCGFIEGAASYIDPCVFVDDDGQPYLFNGGGAVCMGGKLRRDDWTKLDGPMVRMEGLNDFHEATWLNKIDGKYYLSHSDNHYDADGNHMRYAVSDSPLGPWTDMGVYMYPTGSETNHGSLVNFKGQWYALYHTANHSGRGNLRSVCIDPIEFKDGRFAIVRNWGEPYGKDIVIGRGKGKKTRIEAENYNRGGEHYAYHRHLDNTATGNIASRPGDAVSLSRSAKGETYVTGLKKYEWLRYSVAPKAAGRYDITLRVAPVNAGEKSRLHLSANGSILGGNKDGRRELQGEPGVWQTIVLSDVELPADTEYLDLRIEDGHLDFDRIDLVQK